MTQTLAHRQLAMQEPRLFEDFRLVNSPPERIKEITVVESAYDSVLCADFTYVSTPITSGAILYDALDRAGLTDLDELRKDKDFFYNNVILPNIKAAELTAQYMLKRGGAVIAPAVFEARSLGWGQDEYMGLWLDTIERKATCIAMVDGWQYSNGGCEEYLQALLMQAGRRDRNNISIVDARGEQVRHADGMRLMLDAVVNLRERGFVPKTIAQVLYKCSALHSMVSTEQDYGQLTDRCGKSHFVPFPDYAALLESREEMRALAYEIRGKLQKISGLVDLESVNIVNSMKMHPGLIRNSERHDLMTQPSKTIKKE